MNPMQVWDADDVLLAYDYASRGWPRFGKNDYGQMLVMAENVKLFESGPFMKPFWSRTVVRISYLEAERHLLVCLDGQEAEQDSVIFGHEINGGFGELPFDKAVIVVEYIVNARSLGTTEEHLAQEMDDHFLFGVSLI